MPLACTSAAARGLLVTLAVAVVACGRSSAGARAAPAAAPLPFDTVGAGRGTPPNPFEYHAAGKWLAGDTTVWVHLGVLPRIFGPDSSQPGFAERPQIGLRAYGRDTDAHQLRYRALQFAECPFDLRLYTNSRRQGPPVWQSSRAPRPLACPRTSFAEHELTAHWPVTAILGDSLPHRTYYFAYSVRLADGRRLEYSTGQAYLSPQREPPTRDLSALRFTSGSEVRDQAPRELHAWTVVTNPGNQPVRFEHGGCGLQIRLWRNANRQGPPAWRSEFRQPVLRRGDPPTQHYYFCSKDRVTVLPPADTTSLELSVPVNEVLADSLPEGWYWVGVEFLGLSFAAGDVMLDRSPDPFPSVRRRGPIRIEAATRLIRGLAPESDTVRTFVLMTNTGADSADVELVRGNPLMVHVFRSAADRDFLPLPQPVYTIRGASRYTPHRFPLAPGQRWLFENSTPARDILQRLGPGRYYFLAHLMNERSGFLSAGDVSLARQVAPR